MGLKTSKNFITTNAVQNITSVPRQPQKVYVDTRGGHKNLLEPSGLEPVYTNKKVHITINDKVKMKQIYYPPLSLSLSHRDYQLLFLYINVVEVVRCIFLSKYFCQNKIKSVDCNSSKKIFPSTGFWRNTKILDQEKG